MVILGHLLLGVVLLYFAIGLAVGFRFAIVIVAGFNERAATSSFPFRMLLIPGAALLWPVVLRWGSHGVGGQASTVRSGEASPDSHPHPAPSAADGTRHGGVLRP